MDVCECVFVLEKEKHKCLMCTDMIQNRLKHTVNKNHDEWTRQRKREGRVGERDGEKYSKHILKWSRS